MSKLTNLTSKCPACGHEIKLRSTKKEGVLWGGCPICFFRGFFPEDAIKNGRKLKEKHKEQPKESEWICPVCNKDYKTYKKYQKHLDSKGAKHLKAVNKELGVD